MTLGFRVLVLVGVVLTLGAGVIHASDSPNDSILTICQISNYGKEMDGQKVRVRAVWVSDLMHSTLLKDRRCPSSNVTPFLSVHLDDASVRRFDEVVGQDIDDFELRVLSVDISGVFRWCDDAKPQRQILIDKIWSSERKHGDWKRVDLE